MDNNQVGDFSKGQPETTKKRVGLRPVLILLVVVACGLAIAVGILGYKVANPGEEGIAGTTSPAASTTSASTTPTIPLGQTYNSHSGQYKYAAVAADYGLCSKIGTQMIVRGVSTVDSAIAVLICQGATQFHSCGIGGGHFMTIYDRNTGTASAIIGREQAPLSATEDMYFNSSRSSTRGGTAVAVPTELRGIKLAYDEFGGSVPWKDLFQPTIDLCTHGFPISGATAETISSSWDLAQDPKYKALKDLISDENGEPLIEGDLLKRPNLAATLTQVAENGIEAFYDGSLSDDIVKEINDAGGDITREDLRTCTAVKREPVQINLANGDYTVYGPPPPSSGAVVQYILNILDGFNMNGDSISSNSASILSNHRYAEAMKFGFGKRSNLGDADFVDVVELVKNMTSDDFADYYRLKIKDDRTMPLMYYEPDFEIVEDHGTSHMSILGRDGSAVGITTTINFGFGSKIRGDKTGIIYNDEMDDFSTAGLVNGFGVSPSPSNFIKPGKRPMSSMSPTIVVDKTGDVVMIAGASGGTRIISATAQTLLRRLWWDQSLKDAVDIPRLHDQLLPNDTYYEREMQQYLLDGLAAKGHKMTQRSGVIGVVQTIHNTCPGGCSNCSPCISAVCDGRKGGYPDGF